MLIISAALQSVYSDEEIAVSSERRAALSQRGRLLLEKFCGTDGKGICAESFAEYHLWRGEYVVVQDFLAYLRTRLDEYRHAPHQAERTQMTELLIGRIEVLVGTDLH